MCIPPVRSDYQKLLPPNMLLLEAQKLFYSMNVKIYDFSNDADFYDDDFYDYDHLNTQGAEKFSKKLKGIL